MRLACSSGWRETRHAAPHAVLGELHRLGFARVALGPLLSAHDPRHLSEAAAAHGVRITSLHHPEAQFSVPDVHVRRAAVDRARRTIDAALTLGATAVLVELGPTGTCDVPDAALLACVAAHGFGSREHRVRLAEARAARARAIGAPLDAALASARALAEHARGSGVRIGVMTGARFSAVPSVTELSLLLHEADVDYWHVIGRAHRQVWTGRWRALDLLHVAAQRLLGMSVADARWDRERRAPGQGDVDFLELAPFARPGVLVTLDLAPDVADAALPVALETLRLAGLA